MKKLTVILTVLGFILAIAGCNKFKNAEPSTQQAAQGVSFSIAPGQTGGLKSTVSTDCFSQTANYAKITIDGIHYIRVIFYVGGVPYTNTLQLGTGLHHLQEFTIWSDHQTPNDSTDDVMLSAVPHTGSNYAPYVTSPLDIAFSVEAFKKTQLPVEAVCYQPSNYTDFGFTYFQIEQVTVREQPFFGDLCIKSIADYSINGSPYLLQSNGIQLDLPAIFKIEVYRNNILMNVFNNEAWNGEGQPLKVLYADRQGITDNFEFKLFVKVRKGPGFDYVYFKSWTITDAQVIPQNSDGVCDFSIGYCNPNADYVLPPWINLPNTATYTITGVYAPGGLGGYVDASLTNVLSGYEIVNGTFASWCCDHQTTINVGTAYNMNVYSSLYPALLPVFGQNIPWDKINWLLNHLDWYPGYHWYDLQGAIWLFDNPAWNGLAHSGVPNLTAMMTQMHNDANAYGANYHVPTGGWAAVVFIPVGTPPDAPTPTIQTMFIKLDP
ncbi:MAG: hypothetical protein NTY96_09815 [Bacteroidetes bacterium]|nr:hypothetical protein [Bacteroidota bacterium]